jgi:hypothetical protein
MTLKPVQFGILVAPKTVLPQDDPGAARESVGLIFPDKPAAVSFLAFVGFPRWSMNLANVLAKLDVHQVFVCGIKDELLTAFGTLKLPNPLNITLFNPSKVNRHLFEIPYLISQTAFLLV